MIEGRQGGGPSYGMILAIVVATIVMGPCLLGDQLEALTEAISELLSPFSRLLLPLILILTIQFLSSERGSFISAMLSSGEPADTIHWVGGSPVGVTLVLLIVLFLLYNRMSNNGGGDEDSGE